MINDEDGEEESYVEGEEDGFMGSEEKPTQKRKSGKKKDRERARSERKERRKNKKGKKESRKSRKRQDTGDLQADEGIGEGDGFEDVDVGQKRKRLHKNKKVEDQDAF